MHINDHACNTCVRKREGPLAIEGPYSQGDRGHPSPQHRSLPSWTGQSNQCSELWPPRAENTRSVLSLGATAAPGTVDMSEDGSEGLVARGLCPQNHGGGIGGG